MKIVYTKKLIILVATMASLSLGSMIVFAAAPIGGYTPGANLNPDCLPNVADPDCIVRTAWQFDTLNNYIYNNTDFIGIGTDTPTSVLTVIDEVDGVDASGNSSGSEVIRTVNPTENITNSTYIGSTSQLNWNTNETAFDLSGIPFGVAALTGSASLVSVLGSGSISDISGLESIVVTTDATFTDNFTGNITDILSGITTRIFNTTTGSVEDLGGLFVDINNLAPGSVSRMVGADFSITVDAGNVENITGVDIEIENLSGESSSEVSGFRVNFDTIDTIFFEPLELNFTNISAVSNVGVFAVGAGSNIDTTPGQIVAMINFEADSTAPVHAVTSSQHIAGLRIWGGNTDSYGLVAENGDAYGVYIGDYGLDATANQYGLYISDLEANNYLSNGVRIGLDSDDNKIDDGSNGVSSATMYIGNETIDTSVSDRRLKDNIQPASKSALDFLADFEVVEFDWLPENDRSQYGKVPFGLIAQDVDELSPQYTKKTDNPEDYMSVRFQDMVPALIGAIQELQSQISSRAAILIDNVKEIFVKKVTTQELCVGNRCVTEEEFGKLLDLLDSGVTRESNNHNNNTSSISEEDNESVPDEQVIVDLDEEENTEEQNSTEEQGVDENEILEESSEENIDPQEEIAVVEESLLGAQNLPIQQEEVVINAKK
ncbi:MAG: tail fiber domain-containing protein [Candidatus Pacebacteria bacterium]|nr:tail fiber domain-containing protein [Candidatus Paceibacterota bacterium]